MPRIRFSTLFLLAISLLAAACSPPNTPGSPTLTPRFKSPVNTLPPHPSITAPPKRTATPKSSLTTAPIKATATQIPAPTGTPTLSRAELATQASIATLAAVYPSEVLQSFPSPDQAWQIEIRSTGCITIENPAMNNQAIIEQLFLIQADNQSETVIATTYMACQGLGAVGLGGWFWSPNSRYFYYTDARTGSPDGAAPCWGQSIILLDVANKKVIPLSTMWERNPNQTDLALERNGEIVLWSIDNGFVYQTSTANPQAPVCQIAWAPDSMVVAYLQSPCISCNPVQFSIAYWDLREGKHAQIGNFESYISIRLEWVTNQQIKIIGVKDGKIDIFIYDLSTRKLQLIPPL